VNIAPDDAALRWRTYGRWTGLNLLVFGALYPLVNWLTGVRASTFGLYLDSERTIPFLPVWIWAYLSINLLFLLPPLFVRAADMPLLGRRMLVATVSGCLIFLLLPARLGFERVVPGDGLYRAVFGGLFQADGPHNLVPSLHVTYASLCILSFQAAASVWRTRVAWGLWLATIMASTVLVHQHHLLDVASGLALAVLICAWIPARRQAGEP
jgi:membrane-associated phospholipid phosphatase